MALPSGHLLAWFITGLTEAIRRSALVHCDQQFMSRPTGQSLYKTWETRLHKMSVQVFKQNELGAHLNNGVKDEVLPSKGSRALSRVRSRVRKNT